MGWWLGTGELSGDGIIYNKFKNLIWNLTFEIWNVVHLFIVGKEKIFNAGL